MVEGGGSLLHRYIQQLVHPWNILPSYFGNISLVKLSFKFFTILSFCNSDFLLTTSTTDSPPEPPWSPCMYPKSYACWPRSQALKSLHCLLRSPYLQRFTVCEQYLFVWTIPQRWAWAWCPHCAWHALNFHSYACCPSHSASLKDRDLYMPSTSRTTLGVADAWSMLLDFKIVGLPWWSRG